MFGESTVPHLPCTLTDACGAGEQRGASVGYCRLSHGRKTGVGSGSEWRVRGIIHLSLSLAVGTK